MIKQDEEQKKIQDNEEKRQQKWREISEYLKGGSLLEIYLKAISIVTNDEIINFKIKQICVRTGMNLLPVDNGMADDTLQQRIKNIYNEAKKALKDSYPSKRQICFDYNKIGTDKETVQKYIITSNDLDQYNGKSEDLKTLSGEAKKDQYLQCTQKLEEMDNQIQSLLTQLKILPLSSPDLEIDKTIADMLKNLFSMEAKNFMKQVKEHAE